LSAQANGEGWTQDFFRVYGFAFRLRTNQPEVRACLKGLYGQFRESGPGECWTDATIWGNGSEQFCWSLEKPERPDESRRGTQECVRHALLQLEACLCESVIRSQERRPAIHGAALLCGDTGMLVVGRSGAGKSTLSMALARRGFALASDDVALADPDTLEILPIPRCIHLDDRSVALLVEDGLRFPTTPQGSAFLSPRDFGVAEIPPCRARKLVFVCGTRGEVPRLTAISQAEMAARLLQETGLGPLNNAETVLSRLAAGADCYQLQPGPLAQTADALAGVMG